jgi:PII-like signaling protein
VGGISVKGSLLRFYVHESRKHRHILLYEWLLEQAREMGIHGGTVFRAIAGFGRHGVMREEHFFELAGDLAVQIDFAVSDDDAQRLLDRIAAEGIGIFYVRAPIEYGTIQG